LVQDRIQWSLVLKRVMNLQNHKKWTRPCLAEHLLPSQEWLAWSWFIAILASSWITIIYGVTVLLKHSVCRIWGSPSVLTKTDHFRQCTVFGWWHCLGAGSAVDVLEPCAAFVIMVELCSEGEFICLCAWLRAWAQVSLCMCEGLSESALLGQWSAHGNNQQLVF
jgi:hypothetical protein